MKNIENKGLELNVPELKQPIKTTYFQLILDQVKATPKEGFSYDLMKKVSRVDLLLDKAIVWAEVPVEDADLEFIKEKINGAQWAFYAPEIIEFMEYIKAL